MVLIIDNYDSFVFNLARYIEELGYKVKVIRNNKISIADIETMQPTHIIISPGPCGPEEAGVSIEVVRKFAGKIPILGICLGHQVIGHVFGGHVVRAQKPLHGRSSLIHHDGLGIFHGLPSPLKVGRYHSLIVDDEQLDSDLVVTSRSAEGEVMSIASNQSRLFGLQFHPESILTEHGHALIHNFLSEFDWFDRSTLDVLRNSIPINIFKWLTLPNNITETIKKTGADFSLKVLKQSLDLPYADEIAVLKQNDADLCLIRKVVLFGNNNPMTFARVIVPKSTYLNYQQEFDSLGNSPIGNALLYGNQEVTRSVFHYRLLKNTEPMFQELQAIEPVSKNHPYWMRRSIFTFPKGELLISEVFLDNIGDYPEEPFIS